MLNTIAVDVEMQRVCKSTYRYVNEIQTIHSTGLYIDQWMIQ